MSHAYGQYQLYIFPQQMFHSLFELYRIWNQHNTITKHVELLKKNSYIETALTEVPNKQESSTHLETNSTHARESHNPWHLIME